MSSRRAIAASLAGALVALVSVSACMTIADPVATGGTAGIIASGGGKCGSGGSSAGGAGGSVGGSGGSGANTGIESCQNGVDDDQDGEIDCADSDCVPAFTCVSVPSGWTAVLTTTAPWSGGTGKPIACADGSSATRYLSGPAGAASCTPCTCGSPIGTCGSTPISCSIGDASCNSLSAINVSTCSNFGAPGNGAISCVLGPTSAAGAACPASTSSLTNPDSWQSVADTCPLPAGGCAAGQVCVPKDDAAGPRSCVLDAGTTPCPSDWPSPQTIYTGGTDQRACGNCTCLSLGLTCATDTFQLMTQAGCVDFGPFPTFTTTSCKSYNLSGGATWSLKRVPASDKTPNGSCTAIGGTPTGSVQTSGKTTLCCR